MSDKEKTEKKPKSEAEKKYIPICIVMCVLSLVIGAAVFFFEMYLSYFSTIDNVLSKKWVGTELTVMGKQDDPSAVMEDSRIDFPYLGKVIYLIRYNYDAYGDRLSQGGNNWEIPYYGDASTGDKLEAYFKADDPTKVKFRIPFSKYLIIVLLLLVLSLGLASWSRFISRAIIDSRPRSFQRTPRPKKKLKISFMDIPAVMFIAVYIICFVSGMIAGASRVGAEYTDINESVARDLAARASAAVSENVSSDY